MNKQVSIALICVLCLLSLIPLANATSLTVSVPKLGSQSVTVNLKHGDFVSGTIAMPNNELSIGANNTVHYPNWVDFTITDPKGTTVKSDSGISSDTSFSFFASVTGTYVFCFQSTSNLNFENGAPSKSNVTVILQYSVSSQLVWASLAAGITITIVIAVTVVGASIFIHQRKTRMASKLSAKKDWRRSRGLLVAAIGSGLFSGANIAFGILYGFEGSGRYAFANFSNIPASLKGCYVGLMVSGVVMMTTAPILILIAMDERNNQISASDSKNSKPYVPPFVADREEKISEIASVNNSANVSEEDKEKGVLLRCKNAWLTETEFHYCNSSGQISNMVMASVHKNGSLAIQFNNGKTEEFRLAPDNDAMDSATEMAWNRGSGGIIGAFRAINGNVKEKSQQWAAAINILVSKRSHETVKCYRCGTENKSTETKCTTCGATL